MVVITIVRWGDKPTLVTSLGGITLYVPSTGLRIAQRLDRKLQPQNLIGIGFDQRNLQFQRNNIIQRRACEGSMLLSRGLSGCFLQTRYPETCGFPAEAWWILDPGLWTSQFVSGMYLCKNAHLYVPFHVFMRLFLSALAWICTCIYIYTQYIFV